MDISGMVPFPLSDPLDMVLGKYGEGSYVGEAFKRWEQGSARTIGSKESIARRRSVPGLGLVFLYCALIRRYTQAVISRYQSHRDKNLPKCLFALNHLQFSSSIQWCKPLSFWE